MKHFCLTASLFALLLVAAPQWVRADGPVATPMQMAPVRAIPASYLTPDMIRRMPMVARPDRPGHFIGNTVRRFYRGRR